MSEVNGKQNNSQGQKDERKGKKEMIREGKDGTVRAELSDQEQ